MKFFTYFSSLFLGILLLVLSACQKDPVIVSEASHRVVYTSEMDFENQVQINGQISFGDISAGVESRMWTFPAGVADLLDSDDDQSSTEEVVQAIFTKVGQHEIKLSQTFTQEAFSGTDLLGTQLDTTIIVTVLDSIKASVEAHILNADGTLGEAIVLADGAANEVPASKTVRYTFTGVGEPESFQWEMQGGTPEVTGGGNLTLDVKYKFLGEYDMSLVASRKRPFGGDTLAFTDLIHVVPSTDPVVVERISDRGGNIALEFVREMDASTIELADFVVSIENDGNVWMPGVESVELDPVEGNVIVIRLAGEAIYNDDIIRISYVPGSLFSLDGVAATGFSEEELVFSKVNILK
ncbi:MAG: hypothetical protein AAF399_08510 [Bacteroidota bacterium]